MGNKDFIDKLSTFFRNKYKKYIIFLISEIDSANYSIDISIYTSDTIQKSHSIIQEYMNSENITNEILKFPNNFTLNFETFLFSLMYSEKAQIDVTLFKKIFENNLRFSEK